MQSSAQLFKERHIIIFSYTHTHTHGRIVIHCCLVHTTMCMCGWNKRCSIQPSVCGSLSDSSLGIKECWNPLGVSFLLLLTPSSFIISSFEYLFLSFPFFLKLFSSLPYFCPCSSLSPPPSPPPSLPTPPPPPLPPPRVTALSQSWGGGRRGLVCVGGVGGVFFLFVFCLRFNSKALSLCLLAFTPIPPPSLPPSLSRSLPLVRPPPTHSPFISKQWGNPCSSRVKCSKCSQRQKSREAGAEQKRRRCQEPCSHSAAVSGTLQMWYLQQVLPTGCGCGISPILTSGRTRLMDC